ncbi:heme-dependent oxidative N-demethylase subunit alpha family protein [Nitriliruptor alkaliphilus]|uniref:heme-dependent oxidative N-demethylase subunit alpha family protein n=1 Tax=Nitriliruptor alkaliphilus TaxID=427918 RepID=UPI000695FF07|nr:heme-dependent oxidative N-demethylase subunit alpha family protein [Nitriliruptor alkaliphilus]
MTGSPAAPLPPVVVPFAVRAMPHVRPDLWPLTRPVPPHVEDDGPRTLVRIDAEVPRLVAAARQRVATDPAPWTSHTPDLAPGDALTAGLALGRAVSRDVPELLMAAGDSLTVSAAGVGVTSGGRIDRQPVTSGGEDRVASRQVADRLAAVPPEHRLLEAVALAVAEDVVLVDASGRAVWLHVCTPSGWDPGAAAGRHLSELHGPVPAADRLRAASDALTRAIVTSGPHVRWVWGLTDDPAAAHHPRFRGPPATARGPIAELTFRAERQTTLALPDLGLGVFLIRVLRAPLGEVASSVSRRARLAEAIEVMPPELARYKGVADRRDELLDWLTAPAEPRR